MIKSVERIKGLGVYRDYSKPSGTENFGIKNVIYGWNYSGKTTLSRLFAQLETKKPNPDLSGCEYTFNSESGPITEKNIHQSSLIVRVFNSDFVSENLHFEGGGFNPILLLGKESEAAQRKIDRLADRDRRSSQLQRRLEAQANEVKRHAAEAKTEGAKFIRQRLNIDPYTATQLEKDIALIKRGESRLISEKDLEDAVELSLTPDSKKPTSVDEITATPAIKALYEEAKVILASTPIFSNTIKHLEQNPELERWVETGLRYHPSPGMCEFCGNEITEDRLESFRAHFSKDLAEHKKRIEGLLARVLAAELKLSWPKDTELNPQFRDAYRAATLTLPKAIETFNGAIRRLAEDVRRKVDDSRKMMEPEALAEGLEVAVSDAVRAVNEVIRNNNEVAENFSIARTDAKERAKYHYVQNFVNAQDKEGLGTKHDRKIKRRDRLRNYSQWLQESIEKLQAEISQAQQGREKINERLALMLGSGAVQIKVIKNGTGEDRFQLVRSNGAIAKNLSDGERTAIAFSYFLTKLLEIHPTDFKETIVYIDDPVSSLDANHIFQVTAAIRAIFFTQKSKNEPWETTCKQVFISTHSFEFFNLIREIKPVKKEQAKLFLIKKISKEESMLENMPDSLARYQSEYHFLFYVINRFQKAPDKAEYEEWMLLPNAMRRFIELYTYSRIPGPKERQWQVDERAEALFGVERAKRILKIFHYFSHGNTLDRISGNSELIFDLEHAVNDLIDAITENDKPHMDALLAAVAE